MSLSAQRQSPCIVVTGVAGTGKTTVARLLAESLSLPFAEGDDFHSPAEIAKMSAGTPLDDADRQPWLESIGRWLHERDAAGRGGVVSCSALKRHYRDTLRTACPGVFFLHLTASRELLANRISQRTDHFMPTSLLDSQLATLGPDEQGASLDAGPDPHTVANTGVDLLPWPARGKPD
ncbi:gluconokinase [Streptomyces sp. NPDC056690]|uniref:gluconokinase n=1 Tax=unclassified Streptomyces TaxID=2593676 RepID=UPI00363E2765